MMDMINSIISFWFGSNLKTTEINAQKGQMWWSKNDEIDQLIKTKFENTTIAVSRGEHTDWEKTAQGLLACIIVLDQFPRNMYRGTPASFQYDHQARMMATQMLELSWDKNLVPAYRCFAYLPFEHSESLEDQDLCVSLFDNLRNEAEGAERKILDSNYQFALKHREIILRYGRFPHRNAVLGRQSTEEEIAFLQTPGSSF